MTHATTQGPPKTTSLQRSAISLVLRFLLVVSLALAVIAIPAVSLLHHYQMGVLEKAVVEQGDGLLNAYIAQTADSIEQGQPRTFQRVMDNIARIEGISETALYGRIGLMVYRSGEVTVGKPFVRGPSGEMINPNEADYRRADGRYLRERWDTLDPLDAPAGQRHVARVGPSCGECHYEIEPGLEFRHDGRAHVIDGDRASFYYQLPVEAACVRCHTHWKPGEAAGVLGVTISTASQQAEVTAGIRRFVYVLLIISVVVLLATAIIGWMYAQLRERGREVAEKSGRLAALLDHSDQGFLAFGDDLAVDSEYSRECTAIFGCEPGGRRISDLLYPDDGQEQSNFAGNIARILGEPSEFKRGLYLSLMPAELRLGEKYLCIAYRVLADRRIMLTLTDVTQKKDLEEMIRCEQGRLKLIVAAVRDPDGYLEILSGYRQFGQKMMDGEACPPPAELYRQIHTFKGVFQQFDFIALPPRLHEFESLLAREIRDGGNGRIFRELMTEQMASCRQALEADIEVVRDALGVDFFNREGDVVLCAEQWRELEALADRLIDTCAGTAVHTEIKTLRQALRRLRYPDIRSSIASWSGAVRQIAERLGKGVHPLQVVGDCVRLDPDIYQPFLRALVHLFRNAVDHGIESPEERVEMGKDESGTITCTVAHEGDRVLITISDDGAGIDPGAVRHKAGEIGLGTEAALRGLSDEAVLQLIFADEFSTRSSVSDLSGRGIGLAAVRCEVERLGGTVTVTSLLTEGTTFHFSLPCLEETEPGDIVPAHSV